MNWQWEKHELIVECATIHKTNHTTYHLDLPGIYQAKNLLTVLEACTQLREKGWEISEENIRKGVQYTKKLTGLHGRWEIINNLPLIVLDVAHNADGITQLVQQIELTTHNNLHIILGMVKDKEIEKVLSLLPHIAIYYFTQAAIPRAIDSAVLQEKAKSFGLKGNIYTDVNNALSAAKAKAGNDDMIIVCGSVFLVGEVV